MKFGGTSVGSPEAIKQLITIVIASKEPVGGVVVSAFSKVTNQLVEAAKLAGKGNKRYLAVFSEIASRHTGTVSALIIDPSLKRETMQHVEAMLNELESVLQGVFLLKEVTPKILDVIMSYGERFSAYIIAQSFKDRKYEAEFLDARQIIKTDANFGSARVEIRQTQRNIRYLFRKSKNRIKIITGFIGSTQKNETTTFGRGGSDYTASLFGSSINAPKIEIWTDVDGVLTADPRKVKTSFTIDQMTFQEAMEMSHFGAKVIYPQTMVPAYIHKIPLVIRNTFHPEFKGTVISSKTKTNYLIKGISSIENVSLALVQGSGLRGRPGVAARLFSALASEDINIIFITQASSEYSICFSISPEDAEKAKHAIEEEFKHEMKDNLINPLSIEDKLTIVAVIGEQMRNTIGVAGKLFTTLSNAKINIAAIAQGSSERNISCVIASKDEAKALQEIHKAFFGK